MIFADTGGWFACFATRDKHFQAASAWLRQNRDPLLTTDYVVDETLTLLRQRGYPQGAIDCGILLLDHPTATIHRVSVDEFNLGWGIFRGYHDKGWSFTDCVSKVVMEHLGITTAFTFDHHFIQFGGINLVPA